MHSRCNESEGGLARGRRAPTQRFQHRGLSTAARARMSTPPSLCQRRNCLDAGNESQASPDHPRAPNGSLGAAQ